MTNTGTVTIRLTLADAEELLAEHDACDCHGQLHDALRRLVNDARRITDAT